MPKSKTRKKKSSKNKNIELQYRLFAVLALFILIIATLRLGSVGQYIDGIGGYLFGVFAAFFYVLCMCICLYIIYEGKIPKMTGPKMVGIYLILFALVLFASAPSDKNLIGMDVLTQFQMETKAVRGGLIGATLFSVFSMMFDRMGTEIFSLLVGIVGGCLLIGKAYFDMMKIRLKNQKEALQKASQKRALAPVKKNQSVNKKKFFFPDKTFEAKQRNEEKQASKSNTIDKEDLEPKINMADFEDDEIVEAEIIRSEPTPIHMQEETEMIINEVEDFEDELPFDTDDLIEPSETIEQVETLRQNNNPTDKQNPPKEKPQIENDGNINKTGKMEVRKDYQFPPISLLSMPKTVKNQKSNASQLAKENAIRLSNVLNEFGVHAKVSEIFIGPAVTKYELKLETGTRVNRISSLQDDIKLALAAKDIRIEAPIPGKAAVGVEIPNLEATTVSFREVLKDIPEKKKDSRLLVPLGKDVTGVSVFAELDKMPHLLIAGATGSGKSVCVNGIICSLLMRTRPDEVRLMLVDPKKVELSNYNGVPHLISPVITDPKKAAKALRVVVQEMERRYELFASVNARNIAGYNEYAKMHNESHEKENQKEILPFIVVILDEVADLMMVASKDVEDCIMRISQMARAAGIHLIVATQRPSTDVITGVVKANIPSRIAFAVSSSIDSRTILDMSGAEKLLGKGDMLFSPMGASSPIRVQGSFVSDAEVEAIVNFVSNQQEAVFDENFVNLDTSNSSGGGYDDLDEEYEDCRDFVIASQKASASLLQRQFRIGYNKAARIIDQLEANGVIGPQIGSKPREVYIRKYEEE